MDGVGQGHVPKHMHIWLAWMLPCRRFAGVLTDAHARLGPMWFAIPLS